jgi:hypothetical protein
LAGAEGFEPTRGLINNQVPSQLGYAPKVDVGSAPLEALAVFSVRLCSSRGEDFAFGWLWMVSGRRAFFMAADIKMLVVEKGFEPLTLRL